MNTTNRKNGQEPQEYARGCPRIYREWVEMAHLSLWTFSCFHRLCFPVYRKCSILLNIVNFANVTKHLSHSDRHFSRKNATWMPHNRLPEKSVERRSGLGRCPPETNSSSLPMWQYVAMIYSRNQSSWFELMCFSQEIQPTASNMIGSIAYRNHLIHNMCACRSVRNGAPCTTGKYDLSKSMVPEAFVQLIASSPIQSLVYLQRSRKWASMASAYVHRTWCKTQHDPQPEGALLKVPINSPANISKRPFHRNR